MPDDNKEKKPGQAKFAFIIRDTPAWIDQHQSWVSDGARKLYKALRSLADAKSGRLLIPGRGWIRVRTVEQKAGMSKPTRLKYMRELLALGAVSEHRDYVTRSIKGRNLKILGQAQITVLPLHAPNPHKERLSPTDKSGENANPEPQDSVSPTDKSPTDKPENGHLRTNSPTVEEVVRQDLSENTNRAAPGSVDVQYPDSKTAREGEGQKAPTPKTDHPPEVLWLFSCLKNIFRKELADWNPASPLPNLAHVRATWKQHCEEYAVPWKIRNDLFAEAVATVRAEFTPGPFVPQVPVGSLSELLASLAESLFKAFWEHDDQNASCYARGWFEECAKQLGIPPDEIDALFYQTDDAASQECDRLRAAALQSRAASA